MAFRVIKTYPEKKEVAARRVRRYRGYRLLDLGTKFLALEKIGEVKPPTGDETIDLAELEDRADLEDLKADMGGTPSTTAIATAPSSAGTVTDPLADSSLDRYKIRQKGSEIGKAPLYGNVEGGGVLEFDPELDATTSPPPSGDATNDTTEHVQDDVKPLFDDNVEDGAAQITVEEVVPFDQQRHGMTVLLGLQRNLSFPSGSSYFTSGGLRYGYSLFRSLLLHTPQFQDSLTVEAGVGFYKLINYVVTRDAYTVMPIVGAMRYNLHTSDTTTFFVYGGLSKGWVISSALPSVSGLALLNSLLPTLGGGLLLRVGPSWDFRADLGLDTISAGMMLRF
jgi:hypothetical protein